MRVRCAGIINLNSVRSENFTSFDFYDVVCLQLQFEMASRYSSKGSERASGFVSTARDSQYNGLSENCIKPGSGESKCGEIVSHTIFLGLSERASSEENLRDVSERIPKSELVPLANHSVHGASSDLPEINPRDQSYQRSVLNVRPSTLAVRGNSHR